MIFRPSYYLLPLSILVSLILPIQVLANKSIGINDVQDFENWKNYSFKGKTSYIIDHSSFFQTVKASCTNTASALYHEEKIDLLKTPILKWSWKVDGVHSQLQEKEKAGDDYPARVYVIYTPNSLTPWRTMAINYVWSNNQKIGSFWPNPFTSNAIMVALQSGKPNSDKKWIKESRNVKEDFKTFFSVNLNTIHGVSIMTDCDNSGLPMKGYYRDIHFLRER